MKQKAPEVICMGMAVVDVSVTGYGKARYSAEMVLADSVSIHTGGDALNEAVIISRLGHTVKLVCGVGEDEAGEIVTNHAQKEGVDISGITRYPEGHTHISIPMIHPDGEKTMVSTGPYSAPYYTPDLSVLEPVKVLSLGSLFRDPFNDKEILLETVKTAKENGTIVCADVKLNDGKKMLKDIKEALPYIDYIFPNEGEARNYTGREDLDEAADVILGYGVKHAVIKLGKDGCLVKSKDTRMIVPSYPIEALDTTGCGDNFAAGFITALVEGKTLRECCEFATAVGAVAALSVGATTGVTSREKVEAFMKEQKRGE